MIKALIFLMEKYCKTDLMLSIKTSNYTAAIFNKYMRVRHYMSCLMSCYLGNNDILLFH